MGGLSGITIGPGATRLTFIEAATKNAEAAWDAAYGVRDATDVEEPQSHATPEMLQGIAIEEAAKAEYQRPARSSVNIMTITFVHDLLGDAISATGSFPLVCDPSDGRLAMLRQLLVAEFDRATAPLSDKNPISPMWGEWTEKPGEDLQREGIAESAPKLIVVKG